MESNHKSGDGLSGTQKEAALRALVQRTGYSLVQENGQRKYGGPPPGWDAAPPERGCEIFIGKLPRDLFEDELIPLCEKIGKIYEMRMMMDFNGNNRGYAFVTFSNKQEAKNAIKQLNNYEIRNGRLLGVCASVDNCRLFVGGIPKTKKREEILSEMKKVTEGVVDVIVYPSAADKTKNRGFAFVEYENHRAAAMARRKLLPGRIQLWGHPIAVDWAEPEVEVDEDTMSSVKILYVRNLMLSTSEEMIEKEFNNIKPGAVERVKKIRDYAFVHFTNREDAVEAMKALNGKVESLESREMWKGFILTVVELRVPSNLTLLPGHLYMMSEALAKEEARRVLEMPSCFLKVSRLEAQLLLERYPECGNLLLRPSGDGTDGVSVTTLQTLNGTPMVRHYKVKREGAKYVIDVEEPFSCTSLEAVVNYFVSYSNKALVPFLLDEDYDKVIGFVEADKENGESVWVAPSAPSTSGPGPAPPKGGPKQLPPTPITPAPSLDKLLPLPDQDNNYVIPIGDTPAASYMNEDVPSPSQLVVPKPRRLVKLQAKLPKPPTVPKSEPKGLNSGPAKKLAASSAQAFSPTTGLADVTAELEEKLQKRRALE